MFRLCGLSIGMTDGGVEPSTQQGSVTSTLMVSEGHSCSGLPLSQRGHVSVTPTRWSLAPMNRLWGTVPQVPDLRTESPQPVSLTRRHLSTDEMQLREVGKLAVYLRKMRWLQRPSHWTHCGLGSVGCCSQCGPPTDSYWAADASTHPDLLLGCIICTRPVSIKWLTWNCCCAGESDCLIETQLCDGSSWLVP